MIRRETAHIGMGTAGLTDLPLGFVRQRCAEPAARLPGAFVGRVTIEQAQGVSAEDDSRGPRVPTPRNHIWGLSGRLTIASRDLAGSGSIDLGSPLVASPTCHQA